MRNSRNKCRWNAGKMAILSAILAGQNAQVYGWQGVKFKACNLGGHITIVSAVLTDT
jgi:hypothetical protein